MTMSNTNSGKQALAGSPEADLKRNPSASSLHDGDGKTKKQKQNHVSFGPSVNIPPGGDGSPVSNEFVGSKEAPVTLSACARAISPDQVFQILDYNDWLHIANYLEPEVEPVTLPERDPIQKYYHEGFETYPPLILDGASGVGKTQQAFALLKGGQKQEAQQLVYINLVPLASDSQGIYEAMNNKFGMTDLCSKIDLALKEVRERKEMNKIINYGDDTDPLSIFSIDRYIETSEMIPIGENFKTLIRSLFLGLLKYKNGILERVYNSNEKPDWTKMMMTKLWDKVLFVDEALPSQTVSTTKPTDEECPKDRLKFLRNLGRALDMRVVLAGTAATAANMWTPPKGVQSGSSFDKKIIPGPWSSFSIDSYQMETKGRSIDRWCTVG